MYIGLMHGTVPYLSAPGTLDTGYLVHQMRRWKTETGELIHGSAS